MTKLIVSLAIVALTSLSSQAMTASQYKHCLERVIKTHGFNWAVAHAGSTVCDKR